jgi:IclR family transcriptional regulator, KDG regulon repressor
VDNTTIKALRVIEALSESDEPRGVAELSRQLGFTKSNTFRILSTLASQGYVRSHGDTGRYVLTLRIWEHGAKVIDRHPVRRVAPPHLRLLFGQLNETILIAVLDLPDVLYIDKMDSDYPVRASARVGARAPAWRTASGKAMLAFQSDGLIEGLVEAGALDTGALKAFRGELRAIRDRGFAISISGSRPGVNSVAAPIWGRDKVPLAAISVSGPTERFSNERMNAMSASVMNTATRISESLGVSSPTHDAFAFGSPA